MLLQGVLLGISLSFLVGPLMFAIVEAGIGQGFRAGVSVASGIWTSDFLYVLLAFYGIEAMEAVVALPHFKTWAGIVGGLMLLLFGIGSILKARSAGQLSEKLSQIPGGDAFGVQQKNYLWWWMRGFLLNTINPGTVFFWLGIVSAVVVPSVWSKHEMLVFFGGMLATLMLMDTLKAWAAKKVRRFLTPAHSRKIQRVIGLLMIVFGLVLVVKTFVDERHF